LKYVEPSKQTWDGTTTNDTLVVTNFAGTERRAETLNGILKPDDSFALEYDKNEVWKGLKQSGIGLAMVTFLHFKFGYVQPLIIQAILGFKTFFTTKEARIHLLHQSTGSGDLKRPFRVDSPFGMSSLNPQPKTDKASIKKAERAMKAD
jgi:hypothetical protein